MIKPAPVHNEAIPALPLSAMSALIDYSRPAEGVVVQEAIAGGTNVTADVFAEAGEVIGATYRERWKSTAGLSVEGMIGPVPEDVGHVVREVCRALEWDGLGNIQMMRRPEGDTVVYEINPRAAGSIDQTRHAGFDFLGSVLRRVLELNGKYRVRGGIGSSRCFQARLVHGSALPVSSRDLPVRTRHFAHRGRARSSPPVHSNPARNKEP